MYNPREYTIIITINNGETMTTAILNIAKTMLGEFKAPREVLPRIIKELEFLTLLTLPILLPFGIMYLASWRI